MQMTISNHQLSLRSIAILAVAIMTVIAFGIPPAQAASGTIVISNASGVSTTEAAGTVTFDVALSVAPEALETVTVGISSSDTGEGTVSPTPLTFTDTTWSIAQTVTATGVDDAIVDGDVSYTITATMSSASLGSTFTDATLDLANTDDDGGVTVSAISGDTTEAGGTATFTVVLDSEPTADVTIGLTSSDTTEGTVAPSSLTFTAGAAGNWATAQTVTVTGVDDTVTDGRFLYSIVTAPATGGNYAGFDPDDVTVYNLSDDPVSATITAISGDTTEAGGTATITIVLDSEPYATVSMNLASSDSTEGTISPGGLTFTTINWNIPKTVTVTGVDDDVDDGDVVYSIVTGSAFGGGYYLYNAPDVSVTNTDDDTREVTVSAISGDTTEAGGTATFTVVLDSEPTADVTIGLTSSDTTEGTVAPASLTFTAGATGNWATAQTVTITGVNDFVVDGDIAYSIVIAAATGGDYAGIDPADVAVTNIDDDTGSTPPPLPPPPPPAPTFDDLGGLSSEAVDAINRLAKLGITTGTSETKFSPAAVVNRWQMALFLVRELKAAGVTLPAVSGSTFTDIASYSQDTQDAMNQLAALSITVGTGAGEFSPEGTVTRRQMALFLTRLLDSAGLTLPDATGATQFDDLKGDSLEVRIAVEILATLGVAKGTAADTFSPDVELPRWQMAIFLIRVIDLLQPQ
jgi:hypothetical protein